jgi:4-amino-4-deoxy-L-arabinose transferase-like glycosyltransferase
MLTHCHDDRAASQVGTLVAATVLDDARPPGQAPARAWRFPLAGAVADRWLIAASALLALVVSAPNLFRYPTYAEGEGIYAMQAWAILHGQITPYPYWYDHPFLGWLQIAPFLPLGHGIAPGAGPVAAARLAALAALVADAVLIMVIARRMGLRRCAAVLAVSLFVFSPLVQTDGRRIFLDNIATPWLLAAFACALPPKPWDGKRYATGICLAIAVLTKETAVLLGPAVLVAVLTGANAGRRWQAVRTSLFAFAGVVALYPLYAMWRGQLIPGPRKATLFKAMRWQLVGRSGSGSVWDPDSSRHRLAQLWLQHDRLLLAGGLAAAVLVLARPRPRAVGIAVLFPTLWVLRPGGYLPSMFEVALLPFLALALATAADATARLATRSALWLRPAAVPTTAGLLGLVMLAGTLPSQHRLRTSDVYVPRDVNLLNHQAVAWLDANLPRDALVLVDDMCWVELASVGRTDPWLQTLWMYEPDTNPGAVKRLPHRWRDIGWVLSTRTLRGELNTQVKLINARRALYHSTLVVTFGTGKDRIELRRVNPDEGPPS